MRGSLEGAIRALAYGAIIAALAAAVALAFGGCMKEQPPYTWRGVDAQSVSCAWGGDTYADAVQGTCVSPKAAFTCVMDRVHHVVSCAPITAPVPTERP